MENGYVAIMQPYVFPYIGYFHLVEASSIFVFLDDVHYTKRGWINRNRILSGDKAGLFTVPISKASQNRLICDLSPAINKKWKDTFSRRLTYSYKKAPYFSDAFEVISSVFEKEYTHLSDLAIESVSTVYKYLGISFHYTKSSICSPTTRGIDKAARLIQITKDLGYEAYVNAPGGKEIYAKDYFNERGVALSFLKSKPIEYKQLSGCFVPWLSIIDVLMFNSKRRMLELLSAYILE